MKRLELNQGTTEWLDWRRGGITATEASAAIGVSKYSTPLKVYNDKLFPTAHEVNKFEEWGSLLEDTIKFRKFAALHPEFEVRQGACYEDEWRRCSLDGELYQDGKCVAILEIKTGSSDADWAPIPEWYKAQVQWQMHVTGIHKVYFAVLINGHDYFEREMEYDADYCEHLECACSLLWKAICDKEPPAPTKADIDQPIVNDMAAKSDTEKAYEVSEAEYAKYYLAKDMAEKAEEKFKAIKLQLSKHFVGNKRLTYKGASFAIMITKKGTEGVDAKKLKAEFPDVYEKVKKIGASSSYPKFG